MLVNRFTPSCHDNPTSKRCRSQIKCSRQYTRPSPPKAFVLGFQFVVLALKPTRDMFEQNHSLALRGVQISLKGMSYISDLLFKADVACICSDHLIFFWCDLMISLYRQKRQKATECAVAFVKKGMPIGKIKNVYNHGSRGIFMRLSFSYRWAYFT